MIREVIFTKRSPYVFIFDIGQIAPAARPQGIGRVSTKIHAQVALGMESELGQQGVSANEHTLIKTFLITE
jgi:hypothetical protein